MSDHERQLTTCGQKEQTAALTVPKILLYPSVNPTAAGFPKNRRVYIYQQLAIGPQGEQVKCEECERTLGTKFGALLYM